MFFIFLRRGAELFLALRGDEMAVHATDVVELDVLRALGRACAGVGAVAESELIHLGHHGAHAAVLLDSALRQQSELADLSGDEEHRGAILAGCHACAAADAAGGIHGLVGVDLRDGEVVGILSAAAVEADVAAGLLDLVECVTVDHEVLDYRERSRTPGLHRDSLAVLEAAHVELAGSRAGGGAMRVSVDIEGAHAAYTLAAVVVEYDRLLTLLDELLVEDVEGFEEGGVRGGLDIHISLKLALLSRSGLTPHLEIDCHFIIHCRVCSF